ncbi:hypothetical protein BDW74DRAFT_163477 [Aspergillus multicolor]|uniref:putative quinol monooxygenase n=1 Tax=Aspergillus multicolor TaxID=41759 RepID=UPI003CCCF722
MTSSDTTIPSISIHITVYIRDEKIPAFLDALRLTFDKVTQEPECTLFQIYQSPQNPGEISWVEHWSASLEYLTNVILKKDYMIQALEVTEPMYAKPREAKILQRIPGLGMVRKEDGVEGVDEDCVGKGTN